MFEIVLQVSKKELLIFIKIFLILSTIAFFLFIILWRNLTLSFLEYDVERRLALKKEKYLHLETLKYNIRKETTIPKIENLYREQFGYVPVNLHKNIISLETINHKP